MSLHIHATDLDHFQSDVVDSSLRRPVLVDFWADWCSPCLVVAPVLESIVEAMDGAMMLVKVEVDDGENMKLAGRYRVRGFPTVILFNEARELGRFSGARSRLQVMEFLQEHLGRDFISGD